MLKHHRPPQARPLDGEPIQLQAPPVDCLALPPSDIRPRRSGPRRILSLSAPDGTRADASRTPQAMRCRETRSPAALAVGRAPRAATPPRRRAAWLRIFVVRCSLPCDPPAGGHSCNGGMIPRFDRAVCDLYGAIRVKAGVNSRLLVRSDGEHLLVPT